MKDVTPARRARAAFLKAAGSDESLYDNLETLLDLYTLLVLIKGKYCTEDDIHQAWLVAGLRFGPERREWFDNVESGVLQDEGDFAQDDMIAVLNAAEILARRGRIQIVDTPDQPDGPS